MISKEIFLAIDIGASSGCHIISYLNKDKALITEEVYRFKNFPVELNGELTWDINYLFNEVKKGIACALEKYKNIKSLAIDTWGVDYVLFAQDKEILPCFSYRSNRTKDAIKEVHTLIPFDKLYEITGSQFQPFNTIYQLFADKMAGKLNAATHLLMIPDYLNYKLTGISLNEYTNASTTGMLDIKTNKVSSYIVEKLGFAQKLFSVLSKPGTIVGPLSPSVAKEVGGNINVVLCASHDTGSAVEGIPMEEKELYLSSGTWSLLGVKHKKGINSQEAMNANYTNEYGPNYIRLQKNIMGLWVNQCLAKELDLDFVALRELAKTSKFADTYNVNDSVFLYPNNMKETIIDYYNKKGLVPPQSDADVVNATYHSLAKSYQEAILELEQITNTKYNKLYIVGGGANDAYLNELTAKITKKEVIALPIEATAIGNIKVQMEAYYGKKKTK
ncbi:MAG: rhamnulokinase [Bacilli bacterium]|jgi:rhamnulokinase